MSELASSGRPRRGPAGGLGAPLPGPGQPGGFLAIDDETAPLYTVGQVADMLRVAPHVLRRLDAHEVVSPGRSAGGQRRYSRREIGDVQRALSLTGEGLTLSGVRRIVALEAQVRELRREVAWLRSAAKRPPAAASDAPLVAGDAPPAAGAVPRGAGEPRPAGGE